MGGERGGGCHQSDVMSVLLEKLDVVKILTEKIVCDDRAVGVLPGES